MNIASVLEHVDFANPVGWLALYGAVLSTLSWVHTVWRQAHDRGRLCVTAAIGTIPHMMGSGRSEGLVMLTLVNGGTKPVHLSYIGGERSGLAMGDFHAFAGTGKQKLDPGESATGPVLRAIDLDRNVRWLGARDTLGKVWKVPRRQLRQLIHQEEKARLASGKSLKR
jgi:hypothetical protein